MWTNPWSKSKPCNNITSSNCKLKGRAPFLFIILTASQQWTIKSPLQTKTRPAAECSPIIVQEESLPDLTAAFGPSRNRLQTYSFCQWHDDVWIKVWGKLMWSGTEAALTPLQGPSNSSFRYLFSRDIFLPGVKDMLNQLGNLEQDKDQISPALLCLRREHLMSRTLTSAAWTRWSASAGAYEASQTEQSSSEPPGIRPRWSPSARTSDTDTADGTDAQSLAVIFTNSYHFLQIHIHLK